MTYAYAVLALLGAACMATLSFAFFRLLAAIAPHADHWGDVVFSMICGVVGAGCGFMTGLLIRTGYEILLHRGGAL